MQVVAQFGVLPAILDEHTGDEHALGYRTLAGAGDLKALTRVLGEAVQVQAVVPVGAADERQAVGAKVRNGEVEAAAHGALYRFVASDDSHRYQGEAGRAFTMVQADDLSQESLFDALDRGRFYCSQGPRFEQISVEDGRIDVTCSPVDTVIFYSNLIWTGNRCQTGKDLVFASYDLTVNRGERYVRIQLIDAQGLSAWSNPILLKH